MELAGDLLAVFLAGVVVGVVPSIPSILRLRRIKREHSALVAQKAEIKEEIAAWNVRNKREPGHRTARQEDVEFVARKPPKSGM